MKMDDAVEIVERMMDTMERNGASRLDAARGIRKWMDFYGQFPFSVVVALMQRCACPVGRMVGVELCRGVRWLGRN